MTDPLTVETHDDRVVLTLDEPDTGNALSIEMVHTLRDALAEIQTETVRCVVLQGAGSKFCSGGDLEDMREAVETGTPIEERFETHAEPLMGAVKLLYNCPVPTVAKVDGPAFGGGSALALACDLALASDTAQLGFGFRQIGLSIDSGISYLLARQVGESTAMDLILTGEVLAAERAHELGLYTRLFPGAEFEERAEDIIDGIATGPTVALKHSKRLLKASRDRSLETAMDAELAAVEEVMQTEDYEEGVTAFLEHRTPEFQGR